MPDAPTIAEAIDLPFEEAIEFFLQMARVPSEHWTDVWRTAHARAFMVAGATADDLLADFQAALAKALEEGTTLAEFRQDFDKIVERYGWEHTGTRAFRSSIIYETNLSTAYAAGRHAQLTDATTLRVFPYWTYVHGDSQRPRPWHLAWNGLTLRADDPFWASHYPPNGWRCSCRVSPTSEAGLSRMGKSGPDRAPAPEMRTWRNPRNGSLHQIPVGIDPGFDYNVGQAWQEGLRGVPLHGNGWRPVGKEPAPEPSGGAGT